MERTPTNVLISMIRPNKKGNRGLRTARTTKDAKNRDHGRLLRQYEKAQSERKMILGTDSYDFLERLEVSRFPKRDRKTWKAGIKLVGLPELLARSRSFIPPPS